ncbi:hypothetical protein GOL22_27355 [Sinorhizobium medicae]|nr:hypothetical protein [Sinorhizobium medicae]
MDGIAPDETAMANTVAATNLTMNPPLKSQKHDSLRTLEAEAGALSAGADARSASREYDTTAGQRRLLFKIGSKATGPL